MSKSNLSKIVEKNVRLTGPLLASSEGAMHKREKKLIELDQAHPHKAIIRKNFIRSHIL